MRDRANLTGPDVSGGSPSATVERAPRRSYVSPKLVKIGLLRDLTYGSLGTPAETSTFKN
jgi:hypothetical protein